MLGKWTFYIPSKDVNKLLALSWKNIPKERKIRLGIMQFFNDLNEDILLETRYVWTNRDEDEWVIEEKDIAEATNWRYYCIQGW